MRYLYILLSLSLIVFAPLYGQIDLSLSNIFDKNMMDYQIFWDIRVPRTLLAFVVGAILAISGLVFQVIFRNPMSTPFTLGVASGATLFTAIAIVLGFASFISLFAFVGAMLTIIMLFIIGSRIDAIETSSLLLVGIALSFFYSASLMVLFFVSDLKQSYEIVRFTMGSLDIVGYDSLYLVSIVAMFIITLVYKYKYHLKLLLTSYQFAQLKGIDVKKTNYILLFGISVAVGVCVSIVGPIGFVGLIVPHIIKTIMRKSSDQLILPIFFYGGVFLVFCDMLARNIGTVSDVPIGVVTSFVGAPFFIYLIMKRKKS